MLQRVQTDADVALLHARVPADGCADLIAACAACCAVGHDHRTRAAADAVKSAEAADGHDAGRHAAGDGVNKQ